MMANSDGNDDGEGGNGNDDDDDLDSEKAFFLASPPVRIRSPQMAHPETHDLGVKAPLDQYEAQKYKWQDPIESPHSPVLTETRLSTRLSFFPDDDEAEEEELASEEVRKLELKGDERLHQVPLGEGPFRDQGEIEDKDVELQLLEVNHHYHGPFQDPVVSDTLQSVGNIFDDLHLQEDQNAVAEADFEVASIITRGGSINLISDSLELPNENHIDKGKATASSIRDSDSFLGLPLSTRVSTDSLRQAFGLRSSSSTFAGSSTVGARYSDSSIMGGPSSEYSEGVGSSSSQGGAGRESSMSGAGTVVGPGSTMSSKIQIGTELGQSERQKEREQSEVLLKAIAEVKAQYAEQYRQIHEELAHLELELEE
ncbi:hypothetical protein BGW39_006320 [Mortierella sp. 14UC]|nr:hypothetical protein BGW39_006320 [Mortierella sp. 14UC]